MIRSVTSTDTPDHSPGTAPGRPAREGECVLCGWAPAAPVRLRRVTGMVLLWRTSVTDVPGLCRLCADRAFHDAQSHNLAAGWWGVIAPVANAVALISNAVRLHRHRAAVPTGLTRDPDVVTPLPGPASYATTWRRPGPWLGTVAAAAVLGVLGYNAFIAPADRDASGTVVSAGTGDATSLHVGDCVSTVSQDEDGFTDVPLVPCSQAHVSEVFATGTMTTSHYPSDDEMEAWVRATCLPAFQAYVGTAYDDSSWDVTTIAPVEGDWTASNPVECLVETPDGSTWTGSARGSHV